MPEQFLNLACWGSIALVAVLVALRLLYVRWRGAPPRPPQRRVPRSGSRGGLDDHAGGGSD